jgi:hypothetical protein
MLVLGNRQNVEVSTGGDYEMVQAGDAVSYEDDSDSDIGGDDNDDGGDGGGGDEHDHDPTVLPGGVSDDEAATMDDLPI